MRVNEKYKGILYIILAAFGFAFMNLFVKLAGDLPAFPESGSYLFCIYGNEKGKDTVFHTKRHG